jgi:hypothetical protein
VGRVKTIRCTLPTPVEPTFSTPQEALSYRSPRNVQLEKDLVGLKGQVIKGGTWSDYHFEYYLSNSKVLRFELEGVKVKWSVSVRPPTIAPSGVREVEPVTLEFKSKPNQKPRRVVWDREAAFRSRIGRRFKKVFAGAACLWLYTEGQSSLLYFNRLVLDPKGTDLLYWTEEK